MLLPLPLYEPAQFLYRKLYWLFCGETRTGKTVVSTSTAEAKFKWHVRPGLLPFGKLVGLFLGYGAFFYKVPKVAIPERFSHLVSGLGKSIVQVLRVDGGACVLFVDFTDPVQQCPCLLYTI